jgi:hypothetical protein
MTVEQVQGTGLHAIFRGLSTDTKPTSGEGVDEGALFIETDTQVMNRWNVTESLWILFGGTVTFDYALKGSLPTPAFLTGINVDIVTGLTASDGTERMIANQHLRITVNSITGSGTVVVTGDSVSESTGAIVLADTENLTVDAAGDYQTTAKWWRVTAVTIPGGISAINYDLGRIGYDDMGNGNFIIRGYRLEVIPTNAITMDFQLQIFKVQDDGNGKMTLVTVEDVSFSGTTPWLVDTKRSNRGSSGGANYTTATATPYTAGEPFVFKTNDFVSYFSSDENVFEGNDKNEGYIIKITWDNCDYMTLAIRF